eukprot:18130-Chlamydomonas_euryale.AAC.1
MHSLPPHITAAREAHDDARCEQWKTAAHTRHTSTRPRTLPSTLPPTPPQLRDDLMTMLIAGHETTAAVLTWTFFCIAQNPRVEQKVWGGRVAVGSRRAAPALAGTPNACA